MVTKIEKTYGLYCPHCKTRILITPDTIEEEKSKLQAEVINISQQLNSSSRDENIAWRVAAITARSFKEQRIIELKRELKESRSFIQSSIDKEFRKVVKEKLGEEKYVELAKLAEDRLIVSVQKK